MEKTHRLPEELQASGVSWERILEIAGYQAQEFLGEKAAAEEHAVRSKEMQRELDHMNATMGAR